MQRPSPNAAMALPLFRQDAGKNAAPAIIFQQKQYSAQTKKERCKQHSFFAFVSWCIATMV
jgi:hypothetical protein